MSTFVENATYDRSLLVAAYALARNGVHGTRGSAWSSMTPTSMRQTANSTAPFCSVRFVVSQTWFLQFQSFSNGDGVRCDTMAIPLALFLPEFCTYCLLDLANTSDHVFRTVPYSFSSSWLNLSQKNTYLILSFWTFLSAFFLRCFWYASGIPMWIPNSGRPCWQQN